MFPRTAGPLLLGLVFLPMAAEAAITSGPTVVTNWKQVTLWWQTDVSSTTEVHWGPTAQPTVAGYPNHSVFSGLAGTLHSRTLTNVATGTFYFRVQSVDGTGSVSTSTEGRFSMPAPNDERRHPGIPIFSS